MKIYQHGDTKSKASKKVAISGHMYNHKTGTIDTYVDGNFSHVLCQLHEPNPAVAKQPLVVGSTTKFDMYNSGPTEWKSQSAVVWSPKKGK